MPLVDIDSRPDAAGRFTRVTFDPELATLAQIRLMRRTSTGASEVYRVPIAPGQHPAFSVLFRRYDMANPAKNANGAGGADYFAVGRKSPAVRNLGDGGWAVEYGAIPAHMVPPADGPALPQHAPIRATVTLRPAADPGWVELDLRFAYPGELAATAATHAWEPIVTFPRVHLEDAPLAGYRLLNPSGLLHNAAQVEAGAPVGALLPVQFTSLYYEGRNNNTGINNVTGLIVMGTDEDGHHKTLQFRRQAPDPAGARGPARLETSLRAPMHLSAARAFVHPAAWSFSGGDANGWGGARMTWRVRAFRLEGAVRDQPVDWHDVAALYRDWARTRTSTLFRKHPTGRTEQGPMDAMSPFTVVTQYSLQGDADPRPDPDAAAWLETHPIVLGDTPALGPDVPGNTNPPLIALLDQVRRSVGVGTAWLEAQIWGAEPGGYYRFLAGWPPRTNLVKNDPDRFFTAMQRLMERRVVPLMTTDPLRPNFDRTRFRGHLRRNAAGQWEPGIRAPFHPAVTAGLAGQVQTVEGTNNRTWRLVTTHGAYTAMLAQRKRGADGAFEHTTTALTAFHALEQYSLCPTPALRNLYLGQWLRRGNRNPGGVFDHGVRLLEFMKHHMRGFGCFHTGHNHVDTGTAQYEEVFGFGPWYLRRVQEMLSRVHALGVQAYPSFALTNEFYFPEALVPWFDEFYDHAGSSSAVFKGDSRSLQLRGRAAAWGAQGIPVQHFVYSQLVGLKANLIPDDTLIHPGYREERKAGTNGRPMEMLSAALDDTITDPAGWIALAEGYFTRAFDRARTRHGLAPAGYPVDGGGTYTYHRAVQDVANLHSRVFRFGAAGVRGERIVLPASWYVSPADYNADALAMGIRAAQMQMAFAPFFRKGWMLGQTEIVRGNRHVRAWRVELRGFGDVAPLRADCGGSSAIGDAVSRRTDITKENQAAVQQAGGVTPLITDQVQHMVWRRRAPGGAVETLYLFANVGNANADVEFRFTRGVPANTALRGRTVRFDGSVPAGAVVEQGYEVRLGGTRALVLPPRTCAAVHVTPA